MVGSLCPEPQSKLITDPRRLRTFSFSIANLLVPRTFSYDVAYPEVAQQGFTFTTAIRSTQPTLPRTLLQGPPREKLPVSAAYSSMIG